MTLLATASKSSTCFTDAALAATPASTKAAAPKTEIQPRRGFWSMIVNAIWGARQRQADLEIARYLAASGGKFTDSTEREISRRLSGDQFRLR